MKQKIGIFPLWWLLIVIQLVNQLHNKILCTYLWLVHKNGLDAVANHWTWSQSWSLLYRRPASFLILIQVLKWSPYALNSWVLTWVTLLNWFKMTVFLRKWQHFCIPLIFISQKLKVISFYYIWLMSSNSQ